MLVTTCMRHRMTCATGQGLSAVSGTGSDGSLGMVRIYK
jgi:hypothetical protein